MYLSPYVEEPLNSKVIKYFVPELRSRKCFSCFEILCSMYICYKHYERFAYRYEYVHFTYSYLAMVQVKSNATAIFVGWLVGFYGISTFLNYLMPKILYIYIRFIIHFVDNTFKLILLLNAVRSRDELISDVVLWTPSHGRAKAERLARTYIQLLSDDTGVALRTCRKR